MNRYFVVGHSLFDILRFIAWRLIHERLQWTRMPSYERPGGGMQIRVADLNGDNRIDVVVAGMSGTWVLKQVD